jgi:hypothetical protein
MTPKRNKKETSSVGFSFFRSLKRTAMKGEAQNSLPFALADGKR